MADTSRVKVWRCAKCGAVLAIWARPRERELEALFPCGCWLFVKDAIRLAQPYANAARVECRCGRVNVWTLEARMLREGLGAREE